MIVGLPDKAVGESRERVRSAILSTGLSWPYQKITVNLAPADLQKEGSHFDLAIALGILIEMGLIEQSLVDNFFVLGELSLDGLINAVGGVISASIAANQKNCGIICPQKNGIEASWANAQMPIIAAPNLMALLNHLKGEVLLPRPESSKHQSSRAIADKDLAEVKDQEIAKRALEITASGGHNLLMVGPPGCGKSMLASRLPGILPPLEIAEILQLNMIYSVNGDIIDGKLNTERPYRSPHHSCSVPAMVGGGTKAKPGEISLAHHGVLFLDELPEFPRQVLDSLRQPIESGEVNISRVNSRITYPANFQLVAAMNPCRCGYLGDANRECKKAPLCGVEYKNKISGPILDRIDLIIEIKPVDIFSPNAKKTASSAEILARVCKAREIQKERYSQENQGDNVIKTNSQIDGKILEKFCELDSSGKEILQNFLKKMPSSMRAINRILRVSRTIADLAESEKIKSEHLLEAISYRKKI